MFSYLHASHKHTQVSLLPGHVQVFRTGITYFLLSKCIAILHVQKSNVYPWSSSGKTHQKHVQRNTINRSSNATNLTTSAAFLKPGSWHTEVWENLPIEHQASTKKIIFYLFLQENLKTGGKNPAKRFRCESFQTLLTKNQTVLKARWFQGPNAKLF